MNKRIPLYTRDDLDILLAFARTAVESGYHIAEIKSMTKKRTLSQNASLHLYCEMIAQRLNESGVNQRSFFSALKEGFEIPCQPYNVKDVFRNVGLDMYQKDSTAKLTTTEISEVYRSVDMGFSKLFNITAAWPSREGV